MMKRRLIERYFFPFTIIFVFFPCLGLLFIALPSSKAPQALVSSRTLTDEESTLALASISSETNELFFDELPLLKLAASNGVCNPPILEPDEATVSTYQQQQSSSCLKRNGGTLNPIAIAVMEVPLTPDDKTNKINRSVIIPVVKNNPSMTWQIAASLQCFYSTVTSVDDFQVRFSSPPQPLGRLPQRCPAEVFHVNCTYQKPNDASSGLTSFNGVFRCTIPSESPKNPVNQPKMGGKFQDRLNVILIGLDSLSRVTWLEQLPKTSQYLTEGLGAVTMEGYNIVGDGTTVAFMALFAGHFYDELHEARRGFPNASTIDDYPFLWKQFKEEADYVTLYDEDQPTIGTFQHRMMGFNAKPVDYYGRPFQLAFKDKSPRIYDCLGSLPTYEEMLSQIKHLFTLHPEPQRKFALVFNGAHSRPTFDGSQDVTHLDSLMLSAIHGLERRGHLNNSLLVLFSDHGARNGKNRATARGKIEERMPFMSLAFPQWFQRKYHNEIQHLKDASRKMTTPFDLHRTLQDVGGVSGSTSEDHPLRGLSLFEPLPSDRACQDAGVLPHWCSCHLGKPSDLLGNMPPRNQAVDNVPIKSFLTAFKQFADEALRPVEDLCESLVPRDPFIVTKMPSGNLVQVSFYTDPGNGQWEVTFHVNRSSSYDDEVAITVADNSQISRTNSYGAAPFCIRETHPHLREFCYCKALSQQHYRL